MKLDRVSFQQVRKVVRGVFALLVFSLAGAPLMSSVAAQTATRPNLVGKWIPVTEMKDAETITLRSDSTFIMEGPHAKPVEQFTGRWSVEGDSLAFIRKWDEKIRKTVVGYKLQDQRLTIGDKQIFTRDSTTP